MLQENADLFIYTIFKYNGIWQVELQTIVNIDLMNIFLF